MASVFPEEVPARWMSLQKKCEAGKAKPEEAIKAMCHACMGFEAGYMPSLQLEIAGCTSPTCPLFAHRPYATPENVSKAQGVFAHIRIKRAERDAKLSASRV